MVIFVHWKKSGRVRIKLLKVTPNNTSHDHLQKLYDLGFKRVSFGVQDYSEKVQKAIHRLRPFHNVAKVSLWAKKSDILP